MLLGWSHGDQEIFSREEMIEFFDVADVNGAASTFNSEKLLWLNQQYIKELPVEELIKRLQWHLESQNLDITNGPDFPSVIDAQRDRAKTLVDLVSSSRYFYEDFEEYAETAEKNNLKRPRPILCKQCMMS